MKILIYFLYFLPSMASAQVFYVEPTEKGFEREIVQKLDFAGYKVTDKADGADYHIKYAFQKIKSINLGSYEAYVKVVKLDSSEVYRSKTRKKQANAYNGYSAVPAILRDITEKDLIPKIKAGLR